MKQATCKDLRGACNKVITGQTADEMGQNCKEHVMKMLQAGDIDHKDAVESMMALSKEDQMKWYNHFAAKFDALEDAKVS